MAKKNKKVEKWISIRESGMRALCAVGVCTAMSAIGAGGDDLTRYTIDVNGTPVEVMSEPANPENDDAAVHVDMSDEDEFGELYPDHEAQDGDDDEYDSRDNEGAFVNIPFMIDKVAGLENDEIAGQLIDILDANYIEWFDGDKPRA